MTEPILIIGATGTVGGDLVRVLEPTGRVRAAVRDTERARQTLGEVASVPFDFERPETFAPAVNGVRAVFLMRPPAVTDARAVAPFVEAARMAGVRHIVFLSLSGVERLPFMPHYRIEQLLVRSRLEWTFLRAGYFMQNLATTHRDEIQRGEIAVPAGRSRTAFIDTRDIAAVAARALTENGHANQAYTLTGAEALDYFEVARIFSEVLGRPVRYTHPSVPAFIARQRAEGQPLPFILVMVMLYTLTRLGMARQVYPDTERILGRPPITLRRYVEDFQSLWRPTP